ITDSNEEVLRKKGDYGKVLRVITNKEGLPKHRKMDQSGSEHYEYRITLRV
ncbi:hypothetical protein M433DRAFT_160732, partial [Acidomyces richmondensis BFW]